MRRTIVVNGAGPAVVLAAAGLAAVAALWAGGGATLDLPWAPELDVRLRFELDGLGALYALIAAGVGGAVFAYAGRYMPEHLAHQGRDRRGGLGFHALMVLFMASMIGLATAQDLVLLFVFWDLTAIASYFLIAYDRHVPEARRAALMALLVTGASAVALLVGALVLRDAYGTFAVGEILDAARADTPTAVAGALILVAALAKSAQAPLHFWLPRAMVAPTPVSAYLHSAAMVAAGVLLIGRLHPVIATSELLLGALVAVGAASIAVGGLLALARDDMKRLLAYSTISQYGYVTFLYGLGGEAPVVAAAFYVANHALCKSALFLTAGAVTEATGASGLSQTGGLARRLPWLAAASGVAVAGLVALPLTLGFFADELFFAAALEHGAAATAVSVAAAGLTFAYLGRFWLELFAGSGRGGAEPVPAGLLAPIAALAAVVLVGGLWPAPFESLAAAAGESSLGGEPASASATYSPKAKPEYAMALGAYAIGVALIALRTTAVPATRRLAALGERIGPERAYEGALAGLGRLSDSIHAFEVRDLRTRTAAVLVPAGVLVAAGVVASGGADYALGEVPWERAALAVALAVTALAGLATTLPRDHVSLVLRLGATGFALAAVYALSAAPDVALVSVLVETTLVVLALGGFALLTTPELRREERMRERRARTARDVAIAIVSGGVAFVLVWGALSQPSTSERVVSRQIRLADEAHSDDVVTAILSDFRALDTLGEISVLAVAALGVLMLLHRGRLS